MAAATMKQLLEAGVHFGHQTRRWNPKMRAYIFAERNGIHIIDLAQTVQRLDAALELRARGRPPRRQILFVGTKKQAQEALSSEAERSGQHCVNNRWLGGMLTNFTTIKRRIQRLEAARGAARRGEFERLHEEGSREARPTRSTKLNGTLGGIREHAAPARRRVHRRPASRGDRGRRGAAPRDPDHRHHRHELRPGPRSTGSSRRTTTPSAPSSSSARPSRRRSCPPARSARRASTRSSSRPRRCRRSTRRPSPRRRTTPPPSPAARRSVFEPEPEEEDDEEERRARARRAIELGEEAEAEVADREHERAIDHRERPAV